MRGYPHFSFWIPITNAKVYVFPIVITFAKMHLFKESPSYGPVCSKTLYWCSELLQVSLATDGQDKMKL